jgi:hypothetical protein
MPSWGAVAFGVVLTGVLTAVAVVFVLRERRPPVVVAAALSAAVAPLCWDLILRHTGGDFFVDAPGYVFPVSFEDAGSGVFATALSALALGLGPMRRETARRLALAAALCGAVALLVDIYLY